MKSITDKLVVNSIFRPEGEMTIYTVLEHKACLIEMLASQQNLQIDLSAVSEMDSAGLQLLFLAKLESDRRNFAIEFVDMSPAVMEVVKLCHVEHFEINNSMGRNH